MKYEISEYNNPARINILGVRISAINLRCTIQIINNWISNKQPNYVIVTSVHGVMECLRQQKLLDIHNQAGLVTPDGMPLVWISKFRGYSNVDRVYGPDLMLRVCKESISHGYRHFFYGGGSGVPESLVENLKKKYQSMNVVGTYSPPFRELSKEEDLEIVRMIKMTNPDIVWVGLGAPKQERWMANHVDLLDNAVLIGVGAAFDFLSGTKAQAPRWMQNSGLEWLFRLITEPRRLWKRYLIYNSLFMYKILLQELRLVHYD